MTDDFENTNIYLWRFIIIAKQQILYIADDILDLYLARHSLNAVLKSVATISNFYLIAITLT